MQAENVVPFKINEGISRELIIRLREKAHDCGWDAVYTFETQKIVVAQWVQLKCRFGCSRYNKSWCCPPATPTPDKAKEILDEYSLALLLVGTQSNPHFYRDNNKKRAEQVRHWKETISMERMLFLEGYYKAFSLVSSACALCKECAYPNDCHFPQEKRPSVESFSIDVLGTLQNLEMSSPVAKDTKDTFTHYAIILVE